MICILMSTYNGEKYLEEQIKSLVDQRGVEISLLVRDDGSTDTTIEILEKWQKRNILSYYKGENIGSTLSFLDLLKKAPDADFYAFCDQDDIWLPDKLYQALSHLKTIPGSKKLYCSNLFIYEGGRNKGLKWKEKPKNDLYRGLVRGIAYGCTMVFDKELRDIINLHPFRKPHPHDLWVFKTAMLLGRVYFDMNSFILYRQHGNNLVGARNTFAKKIRSKAKSLFQLNKQHYREEGACELLHCYSNLLTTEQLTIISIVANYRHSLRTRLELLFSRKFVSEKKEDTFWLKVRILTGYV
ncbi:glycosyltransferase family 2 protein [Parabacteroides sp.]